MTNLLRNGKVWALVLTATTMTIGTSAQAQQAAAPAPAAAAGQTPPIDRYVVGQASPPAVPGSPMINMSLDQAMQVALENNLDLKSAKLNPQLADYTLQGARASFMPRYTSTYSLTNNTTPSNDKAEGRDSVTRGNQGFNASMNQTLPWYGTSYSATFNNGRGSTDAANAVLNPTYSSSLSLSITQPLLAGFKIDNARNTLRTAAISREVADIALVSTIENTKANVRTAYWNLRQAIEQIEIQRRSLELQQRTLSDNRIKVEIGSLAPIDTVQNEATVASSEQSLLNAQISWQTAEQSFKRLLASGPDDNLYRQTINPTEQAVLSVQTVDIPAAVKQAISQRTDIVQTRKNLESTKLSLEVTQNATKPTLSLSAGLNSNGQGGSRVVSGVITPGGYSDALHNLANWNTSGWNLGLNFTLPYGQQITNSRINYARALIQLQQSEATLNVQVLTISSDVTTAGLNVENTYKQYQASGKSREASERNADAAQTRFDNGAATNFEVVTAQNTLTSARLTELRSLISYLNAVAEFDRVQRVGR